MSLSDIFKSSFGKWVESASKKDLEDEYEKRRQEWITSKLHDTVGEITKPMKRISTEISKRSAEEWENNPKRDPHFHWTDKGRWK